MRGLCRTYRMGDHSIHALDGIDLTVRRGEFVAIMGPSGSGKSTMLNVLGCLDTPSAGCYRLAGREVGALDDDALAAIRNREIGFVFQDFNLLPRLTALENVVLPLAYGRSAPADRTARASSLLDRVGLADRTDHRPDQLSGGQRQRVAIARALAAGPAILLADEPTGNLDSTTSSEIMALFCTLHREGHTIVMVTHDPEIAAISRRIVTMKDGRIENDAPAAR
jgi:putative ABC transport system ATP-binding protein